MLHDNLRTLTQLILVFVFSTTSTFEQNRYYTWQQIAKWNKSAKSRSEGLPTSTWSIGEGCWWYHQVSSGGDVAQIDKVRLTSTPRWKAKGVDDRFAENKLQFYTYVFIPKSVEIDIKYPLIVVSHSGIHANF